MDYIEWGNSFKSVFTVSLFAAYVSGTKFYGGRYGYFSEMS